MSGATPKNPSPELSKMQTEQAMGNKPEAVLLRGFCCSSYPQAPTRSLLLDFLLWCTVVRTCKSDKPFLPQAAFGYGVLSRQLQVN